MASKSKSETALSEDIDKKLIKGNCCSLAKSKYINEINQMLLNGTPHMDVYRWLKDRGVAVSSNTTRKHSQHFLLPSSGLVDNPRTASQVAENMRSKKQKNPLLRMSELIDLMHERVENIMRKEEDEGELTPRGDKMLEQLFKMQREYAVMVGERETDKEYIDAELVLALISSFQKIKGFDDPSVKHRLVKSLKSLLATRSGDRPVQGSEEESRSS